MTEKQASDLKALGHTTAELVFAHIRSGSLVLKQEAIGKPETPAELTAAVRELYEPGTLLRRLLDAMEIKTTAYREPLPGETEKQVVLTMDWCVDEDARLALLDEANRAEGEPGGDGQG